MQEVEFRSSPSKAIRPQVLISCACCLVGISYGMSTGHSAVLLPHLQHENSSFVIEDDTASWIASVYALASPVGCLVGGVAMDIWGRKKLNISGNAGMVLGWILITAAVNVPMLIGGRILEGFSRSILATAVTVLVDELAEPKFRGFIVCSMYTCVSIGIMAISSLGALVDWRTASGLAAVVSLINLVSYVFVTESPTWYVKKLRLDEAERALVWLWGPGRSNEAKQELIGLKRRLHCREDHSSMQSNAAIETIRRFFVSSTLKPFFIIHIFNVFQAFCGLGIFTFYTVDIISKTKGSGQPVLNEYSTTIVVSVVRVITVLISSFLMLTMGRRTIALTSGICSSISAISLGVVLLLRDPSGSSPISSNIESKLVFILMLCYAGSMSFGFFALPTIMIGETQPSYIRGFACGYIYTMNDLLLGGAVKLYPWMTSSFQIHGLFLLFGVSCVLCTIFVFIFLPETQGLTLPQIEDYFQQKNIMWLTRRRYNKNQDYEEREIDNTHL